MKTINRLVLYIAAGLLIGETFFKFNVSWLWGFICVSIIIIIGIVSRYKKQIIVFLILLFCVSALIGENCYKRKLEELHRYDDIVEDTEVTIEGKILNIWESKQGVTVELECVENKTKVICYFSEFTYEIGREITVCGKKKNISESSNYGEFNLKEYYNSKEIFLVLNNCRVKLIGDEYSEIFHGFYRVRCLLKKAIIELCNKEEAGVLCAMLFGDKEYLDDEIKDLYTMSGIGHILAISGLHISLAGGIVYHLMRKFTRQHAAFLTSSGIMMCFCGISGASVSTVRAVIMYIINIFSKVIGHKYDIKNAMSVAMIWILIDNPLYINNSGFILSFVSVAGIAFVLPVIDEVFGEYVSVKGIKTKNLKSFMIVITRKMIGALLSSTVLYLVTLIVIADTYYEIPIYSVLLNALLLPLMGVIVISGFMGGMLFYIIEPVGKIVVLFAVIILKIYKFVCNIFTKMPLNTYVTGNRENWQIVLYYAIFAFMLLICVVLKRRGCGLLKIVVVQMTGVIVLLLLVMMKQKYEFCVAILDVGQGDCIYVEGPDGNNYLIDGGSSNENNIGEYKIEPYIKYRGRDSLTAIVITHMDTDHISGIIEILEKGDIKVENIIIGQDIIENENYKKVIELVNYRNINVITIKEGDVFGGDIRFTCLNPIENNEYEDINAASVVLMGEYNDYKFLLTGDIGENEELSIVEGKYRDEIKELLLLKVAHHGSKHSSCEAFVKYVNADVAVISCGKRNMYGHPAPIVVDRFEKYSTNLYITMESGMIWIEEKKGRIVLKKYIEKGYTS